jgi:hypothetical protein
MPTIRKSPRTGHGNALFRSDWVQARRPRTAITNANGPRAWRSIRHEGEISMNRFLKTTVLSAALAATTLGALAPAEAGDRWRHRHHDNGGEVLAAGVLGLAVGAIVGGALNDEPEYRPVYREPIYESPRDPYVRPRPQRPYVDPALVEYDYSGGIEPWSPAWFRWCGDTYRSFDPDTGTYMGYDGEEHFCVAN